MSIRRTLAIAFALAAFAAACAESDGGTANGPEVTLGTVPNAEDTTGADDNAAGVTDPVVTEPADVSAETGGPSTTALTPSPDADLPTEATPSEAAPVTTQPGPLPEPSVRLIEVSAFDEPVGATSSDDDTRLFVVEKGGAVIAVDDESNQTVFDIAAVDAATFTDDGSEQGLLGLTFHPDLDLAYVNFTDADGNTVIAEFSHDPVTFDFDPTSYREVMSIEQPFPNHNGGGLLFGPNGFLYIGTGDGGAADDPDRNGLDASTRLGKLLRIDPLAAGDSPFTVPEDNPFVDVDGAEPTIWSLGLRNPWRFSFDSLTGDLWIADVGQNRWEEVDLAPATDGLDAGRGISFGWSAFEAADRFNDDEPSDGHILPVASYLHEDGNCSISGGVVARTSTFDDLNGWYVYGDYCSGRMWALDTTSVASTPNGPVGVPVIVEIATVPALTAVVEGPFGDIYALSLDGPMYRLGPA